VLICLWKSNIAIAGEAELWFWLWRFLVHSLLLLTSLVRAQKHGCYGIGGILERAVEVVGAVLMERRTVLSMLL